MRFCFHPVCYRITQNLQNGFPHILDGGDECRLRIDNINFWCGSRMNAWIAVKNNQGACNYEWAQFNLALGSDELKFLLRTMGPCWKCAVSYQLHDSGPPSSDIFFFVFRNYRLLNISSCSSSWLCLFTVETLSQSVPKSSCDFVWSPQLTMLHLKIAL